MRGIEILVVLAMRTLYLAVMTWCIWTDLLMLDSMLTELSLKERLIVLRVLGDKALRELRAIICLDFQDLEGEGPDDLLQELHGGIGAVFGKAAEDTEPRAFINGGILVKAQPLIPGLIGDAGSGDDLDVNLDLLAGESSLLIRLGDVFGIGWLHSLQVEASHTTVESGNGALIASLAQLDPENDQPAGRIAATHILDEFYLLLRVLIGMMMRSPGVGAQRIESTVITGSEAIDELTILAVVDSGFRNAVFLSIAKNRLTILQILCYGVHEGSSFPVAKNLQTKHNTRELPFSSPHI